MKKMKDFINKTDADLAKLVSEKRAELQKFRFGGAGSKVTNVKLGSALRKEIARVMTEISARKNKAKNA